MDFISDNFLQNEKLGKKKLQIYFNIYQELGVAWEFLGLQCKHWDGYKRTRDKKEVCRICGKVKDADESYILLPQKGLKKIGVKSKPNSKRTFETKKEAEIINDTINFHGALINVDVHNSYKSKLFKEINIADERIVRLREGNIECSIDNHLISIELLVKNKRTVRKTYGSFPWEIRRKDLHNFPVIFEHDNRHKFLGLTIFK